MVNTMKRDTIAKIVLFLTAVLWGSTFTFGKIATEVFSASFVIAIRFMVASVILLIVAFPQRKFINKEYLKDGFWMGISMFLSYLLQVGGLSLDTSPGKGAFLCTTYSILVPFVYWFVTKEIPKLHHILCVFLCMFGIGVVSFNGGLHMTNGDILTVLSGIPGAVNLVVSALACKDKNVLLLTTIELWVVTIFAWIFVFVGNDIPTTFPVEAVGSVLYLGLIATALCLFLQSYGLKYADATIGGMLLSLESVFGALFAVLIYHEHITLRMLIGFVIIFIAIMLSQWEGKSKEQEPISINQ